MTGSEGKLGGGPERSDSSIPPTIITNNLLLVASLLASLIADISGDDVCGLGKRVPSFYTSPSLVNLSGLGVADQPLLTSNVTNIRSNSSSDLVDGGAMMMDSGSEDGEARKPPPGSPKSINSAPDQDGSNKYTKTTSMAAFYYRRNKSNDQLQTKSNESLPNDF